MLGMSALFPVKVPDAVLAETAMKQLYLRRSQFLIYADVEELLSMNEHEVAILCRNFRFNDFFPSLIELIFRDRNRTWNYLGLLKSLCVEMGTWCLYEDDTIEGVNPYEYYRIDRNGAVEKGLIAPVMLHSEDDLAEMSADELAEVEEERRALSKGWWWPS